jgi:hypothetical protein
MLSRFPVAFRLHGIRFLVIRSPLGDWAPLTVGLPAPVTRHGTPTGLSRCTRMRCGRRGRPLYPGDSGTHTARSPYQAAACRLPTAKSLHPGTAPILRVDVDEASTRVQLHSPVRPSPRL